MPVPELKGKGTTKSSVDTTPLYDSNINFLNERLNKYQNKLTDFIRSTFQTTNTVPIVNGKEITNLNELDDHLKDFDKSHDLYVQAVKSLEDPNIDLDAAIDLLDKKFSADLQFGYFNNAKKQMGKDLIIAANDADNELYKDLKEGEVEGLHSLVLGTEGTLLVEKEANKKIKAYRERKIKEGMDQFYKTHPKPSTVNYNNYANLTDQPNPLMNRQIIGLDGRPVNLSSIPSKSGESLLGWEGMAAAELKKLQGYYNRIDYKTITKRLVDKYNTNTKVNKLKAKAEDIMDNNSGGALTTTTNLKFNFDVDNRKQFKKNSTEGEDLRNVYNFISNVTNIEGAVYLEGNRLKEGSDVSGVFGLSSDNDIKELTGRIVKDFGDQLMDATKQKGTKSRVKGSLEFQPMAVGDENYHAYHIDINPSYLKEDYGSTLAKDRDDLLLNGITILVPLKDEKTKNIKISNRSIKGTTISAVEGMLALSEDGSVSYTIPNSMQYKIQRNKQEGSYTIDGYFLTLNKDGSNFEKQNFRYDTTRFGNVPQTNLPFKLTYDMASDIDEVNETLFKEGLKGFYTNELYKRELSKQKGIKDPKALMPK